MWRLGSIVLGGLDIEGGEFTYGNRIAIGEIFRSPEMGEYAKIAATHKELYGYSCRWWPVRWRYRRLERMMDGVLSWVRREQELLKYTPTNDELAAGIEEFGQRVGDLATIKALAKAYGAHPNEVLKWDYATVFGILYTDLEETKFNRRFTATIRNKSHHGNNARARKQTH